ncbi:hypothetical protein N5C55_12540 [Pseudomonas otitidis]|uniref:hypothetical protein n=1 Tax=Metapseudomonas otitidis TaxID=319939 RepID=UPI0024476B83|nr:hypothetical protein [Pseudomonas otitidis]MDH1107351.1 hypothetical protein [Pseudomonas otitidis]MDH1158997.1 hypothetical protein [Pseudomonas otitidis]MDH1163305.1 hypothetical protein [Pseudomonas otitidis]
MSLADERAATRSGVAASRASTFKRDLNSLETARRQTQVLNTLERKGQRVATRGRGVWKEPAKTGTGGGIAGPLVEPDAKQRAWWPNGYATTDGLLVLPAIKTLKLQDANGEPVEIQLADISAVTP